MKMNALIVVVAVFQCLGLAHAAKCTQDGSDYSYTESVSGSTRTIVTNHCPNHPYYQLNPNYAYYSGTSSYTIPASPTFKGTATDSTTASANIDLSQQGGGVGVLFNGAFLFSPYGGPQYGAVSGFTSSATYAEGNTFDQCGCHGSSDTEASYHCHVPPSCLLRQLGITTSAHSPQIGWAYDGFPVYGPRGPSGTYMKTCTQTSGTYGTSVCTDDCGGYYLDDNSIDNFVYRYYIQGTYDDGTSAALPGCPSPLSEYYPNTPVCYRGCCPSGVTCQSIITSCPNSDTLSGTTSAYTATVPTINSLSLTSGLPTNCGGAACSALTCTTCSSSNQGWSSDACNDESSNSCPSTSVCSTTAAPGATTAAAATAAPGATTAAATTAAPGATTAAAATAAPGATTAAPTDTSGAFKSVLSATVGFAIVALTLVI